MIQVIEETRGEWQVVSVTGRADAEAADELEEALRSAVDRNLKVAADFGRLDYISSAGLRAVLQAARAAQIKGIQFAVCEMSAPVEKVFKLSGMHLVLEVHQDLPC